MPEYVSEYCEAAQGSIEFAGQASPSAMRSAGARVLIANGPYLRVAGVRVRLPGDDRGVPRWRDGLARDDDWQLQDRYVGSHAGDEFHLICTCVSILLS